MESLLQPILPIVCFQPGVYAKNLFFCDFYQMEKYKMMLVIFKKTVINQWIFISKSLSAAVILISCANRK
ncbi:hypothetical protein BN440_1691 [Erwinia amylovora MR1]|nr:hypothetical protein BN440_1691 [Erwinia amylovora MR1]